VNRPRTATAIKTIALIGLVGGCGGNVPHSADIESTAVHGESRKPNIVFVLTDQWRAQATGYSGDPNLIGKTPNLDRIADSGINFRNAISTTPVCTPYRAALLTGRYPTTTGMIFNDLHLPEESYTMAEMFKESGYATAYIGKWHLDEDRCRAQRFIDSGRLVVVEAGCRGDRGCSSRAGSTMCTTVSR